MAPSAPPPPSHGRRSPPAAPSRRHSAGKGPRVHEGFPHSNAIAHITHWGDVCSPRSSQPQSRPPPPPPPLPHRHSSCIASSGTVVFSSMFTLWEDTLMPQAGMYALAANALHREEEADTCRRGALGRGLTGPLDTAQPEFICCKTKLTMLFYIYVFVYTCNAWELHVRMSMRPMVLSMICLIYGLDTLVNHEEI